MKVQPLLYAGGLVFVAAALWLFSSRHDRDSPPANSSGDATSIPLADTRHEAPTAERGVQPPRQGITTRGRDEVLLIVKNPMGDPLAGAWVSSHADRKAIGYCDGKGRLSVDPHSVEEGQLEVGFVSHRSEVISLDGATADTPVVVVLFPDNHTTISVVDTNGVSLSDVRVTLAPIANVVLRGGVGRSDVTSSEGLVILDGLVSGQYYVGARSQGMVLSSLRTDHEHSEAILEAPCPRAEVVLARPSVAWVKPRVGSVVTGYFAIPFGQMDRDERNQECLREIEGRMQDLEPDSCAQAFLARPAEVQFRGFLERGGWIETVVPVQSWGDDAAPVLIENERAADGAMAPVVVRVLDLEGHEVGDAPFALRNSDSEGLGTFTFPIKNGIRDTLPVGRYTFVALQGGLANLFTGTEGEVSVGLAAHAGQVQELTIRAKVPVQRIPLRASWQGPNGPVSLRGNVILDDGLGFKASFHARSTPSALWLPLGKQLRAETHQWSARGKTVLESEFELPLKGRDEDEPLTLEFVRK